jgi:Nif-specific regulatory protein
MRLVAMDGPLAGLAFAVADGTTVHGPQDSLDRQERWFRIRANDDGELVVQPFDRRTPLFVNGLPLTSRPLRVRDEVRFGDSLFVVHAEESSTPRIDDLAQPAVSPCSIRCESGRSIQTTLELGFDDMLLGIGESAATRERGDLLALMRAAAALSSVHGLAGIDAVLAGFVLDLVPAERVLLAGSTANPAEVRSAWKTRTSASDVVVVDSIVLEGVVHRRVASVFASDGHHCVAVPMVAFGRATGAIWADLRKGATVDDEHVRLLLVIGALVAVAREYALESVKLQATNESLQAEINLDHNMVGRCRSMRTLFDRVARVARTDSTVLIRGESGTGKELVARAAHRNSPRAERPFVAINCAALTESLLESELFGHEKGAFTGAVGMKKGKMEIADGGSLFLDEIGELPLTLQAKLLRALQEREFERVGGTRPVRVDFRLIAATNRDLEAAVKAGAFRQDLFYRLNVVTLTLPPLRDRKEDVGVLAEYFVRKHAPRCGRRVRGIKSGVLQRLEKHHWPGNVRELENAIEQALALGSGEEIDVGDLPSSVTEGLPAAATSLDYHATVEETKRQLIVRAFERAGNSHADAARLLGVHPNYLHRLMRNYNLRPVVGAPHRP